MAKQGVTSAVVRRRVKRLMAVRPGTEEQLHRFVKVALGLDVPRVAMTPGHTPPFAYLSHAFFEPRAEGNALPARDCVVWANRGGGKTMLGAVATLLDLLFKPGVQVRILGGSLEQSSRMYEHLVALCERPMVSKLLAQQPTQREVRLVHGSTAAVLAQSQRSVRGVRVHKLRCDEVEEFDPDIWEAAQLVTISGYCQQHWVQGAIETLSTMHRAGGLMSKLTQTEAEAVESEADADAALVPRRVFRWNYLDVMERCPDARPCASCILWQDCGGRAKQAAGFMKIDDVIAQWHRSSDDTWQAEMLCRRPRRSDRVYPNFATKEHVRATIEAASDGSSAKQPMWIGGMDFGLRSPLVMLWAQVHGDVVHVVDEYIQAGRTLEQHLQHIQTQQQHRGHGSVAWLGVDPAGRQRNSHTGLTDVDVLRARGYKVRTRSSNIADGIERIRRRLDRGTLLVHPRCVRLIEAMNSYHFDPRRLDREEPVKDGYDHACDALRYMLLNLEAGTSPVQVRRYV